jgi:hypothetical protein
MLYQVFIMLRPIRRLNVQQKAPPMGTALPCQSLRNLRCVVYKFNMTIVEVSLLSSLQALLLPQQSHHRHSKHGQMIAKARLKPADRADEKKLDVPRKSTSEDIL